jgi:hypothetical protein
MQKQTPIYKRKDYKTLNNFENQIRKKYSKKDYRNLKTTNNVDEIMFVKVKWNTKLLRND